MQRRKTQSKRKLKKTIGRKTRRNRVHLSTFKSPPEGGDTSGKGLSASSLLTSKVAEPPEKFGKVTLPCAFEMRKGVKGGRIGNNTVDMYLIAYPNRRKHDRVMYYMQQNHEDSADLLNIDFVEDLMETMIKSDPPLIAYKKTMKLKEKRD